MLRCVVLYYIMLDYVLLCYNIIYFTILCCTASHCTIWYYAMLYYTILYYTMTIIHYFRKPFFWAPLDPLGYCWARLGDSGTSGLLWGECNWEQKVSQGWIEGWWIPWGNQKKTKNQSRISKSIAKPLEKPKKTKKTKDLPNPDQAAPDTCIPPWPRSVKSLVFFVFLGFSNGFVMLFEMWLWFFWFFWVSLWFSLNASHGTAHGFSSVVLTRLLFPPMPLALWM